MTFIYYFFMKLGIVEPDGTPTFLGLRYRVLSLVLLAGELQLQGAHPAVSEVARRAVVQRDVFYDSERVEPIWGFFAVKDASLYSRQILVEGMLGTSTSVRQDLEADWVDVPRIEMDLAAFDARIGSFDQPTWYGMPPDFSKGKYPVRAYAEVSDVQFQRVFDAISR